MCICTYIFTHSMDNPTLYMLRKQSICGKTDATSLFRFVSMSPKYYQRFHHPQPAPPKKKKNIAGVAKKICPTCPAWSASMKMIFGTSWGNSTSEARSNLWHGKIRPTMDVPQHGKGEWVANIGRQYHDIWQPFRLLTSFNITVWYCLSYSICLVEK